MYLFGLGTAKNKRNAQNLLKRCNAEKSEIEQCGDCFINRQQNDAIKMVCSKPHLLIWARYSDYPYWPAKILSSPKIRGQRFLHVHFFGEHNTANIPHEAAFLYSKEDPNDHMEGNSTEHRDQDFTNAICV